ncbi:MAG: TraB/GumN family protein [Euryarchaeota archaeon]|nr:TraB/GumN family protein [Euryarchaeota archaeon]
MLTLVGVGHVFDLKRQIHDVIVQRRPQVVGVELDPIRFRALQRRETRGDAPVVYQLLSFFQERIADKYGVRVGDEMLAAVDAARTVGADLALIDVDSASLFDRVWRGMSFEERVRFVVAAIAGLFVSRRRVERELAKFQDDNAAYLQEFGTQFPHVKQVLIDDRDAHMAQTLRTLHASRGNIVAVVGDGHVEGLRRRLEDLPVEVIRLKDLRGATPSPASAEGQGVTFSYEVHPPGGKK